MPVCPHLLTLVQSWLQHVCFVPIMFFLWFWSICPVFLGSRWFSLVLRFCSDFGVQNARTFSSGFLRLHCAKLTSAHGRSMVPKLEQLQNPAQFGLQPLVVNLCPTCFRQATVQAAKNQKKKNNLLKCVWMFSWVQWRLGTGVLDITGRVNHDWDCCVEVE